MHLRTTPALRLDAAAESGVHFEHVVTGERFEVEPLSASLLRLLAEPEEETLLTTEYGIPADVIDELRGHGLLLAAADAIQTLSAITRPAMPAFAGAPHAEPADVIFVGVPHDAMSITGPGAAAGPAAIRLASQFPPYLRHPESGVAAGWFDPATGRSVLRGVTMSDGGDIRIEPGDDAHTVGRRVRAAVWICRSLGALPVLLGGDHSLSWWALRGFERERVSVLQLDAHTDLAEAPASGLPSNASVAAAIADLDHVECLVTAGLRGFLPAVQQPRNERHQLVSIDAVRRLGADAVVELLPKELPVYVTLDVDALDPTLLPATNVAVPGGFSFAEIVGLLEAAARRRRVCGLDVTELNGSRDTNLMSASVVAQLIRALLAAAFSDRS